MSLPTFDVKRRDFVGLLACATAGTPAAPAGSGAELPSALDAAGPLQALRTDVAANLKGEARGRVLTAAAIDAHNSFDKPKALVHAPYAGRAGAGVGAAAEVHRRGQRGQALR